MKLRVSHPTSAHNRHAELPGTSTRSLEPSASTRQLTVRLRDRAAHELRHRVVPVHWTLVLAAVSAACFTVLAVTGVALAFFYEPSADRLVYDGAYVPLRGVEMSRAYQSMLRLSLEVRGGLLLRQTHHWAALILPASLTLQMLAAFFTGGFRRPRRSAWVLLCLVFLLTLGGGWSGYGLPDDSLAGTGLRIVEGITVGIPYIGPWLTAALFGDAFPGVVVTRLYWIHVALIPLALLAALLGRIVVSLRSRPAQFPRPGRTEDNVVGLPLGAAIVRFAGMFLITIGVIVGIGGTVTIAPLWLYGPSSATSASAGSQPDWYTGFLDGALRLVPPGWEVTLLGTWPLAVLLPQVVVGMLLVLIVLFPFIEERATKDRRTHHVLDRPRDAPNRTAIGVAGLTFYATLCAASATDIIATELHVAFEAQVYALRACLVFGPLLTFLATRWICLGLQDREQAVRDEGHPTGVILRSTSGGYSEPHAQPAAPSNSAHSTRVEALSRSESKAAVYASVLKAPLPPDDDRGREPRAS